MIKVIHITLISLILSSFAQAKAEWKNCPYSEHEAEAVFYADCPLLKLEGHDIEKMKRTGKRHKFSKTVISETGAEPYLKN